ncbi:MAG: iron ABC transporter permease [Candidatus Firestonebacteria bacterium]|nr:iron ABC transporter permease [Candidatus Firestonebacteria bacterium]
MKSKFKTYILLGVLLLIASVFLGIFIGGVSIPPKDAVMIMLSKTPFLSEHFPLTSGDNISDILFKVRIPRVLLALLVGAALSVAGAVFQGLLKNPLADPYLLGVSSGAALGAAIIILSSLPFFFFGVPVVPFAAFMGALLSMFLVYALARTKGKISLHTLLLSGVIINFSFSALIMLFITLSNKGLTEVMVWMMGSLNNTNYDLLPYIAPAALILMFIIYMFSNDLNIIAVGEETAVYLGVKTEKVKQLLFVLTSMLTALAVSVSGLIGFVGLIIPHIARMIVGPDHRILIPFSALCGGIFLILSDTLCRSVIAPSEIPTGVVTAILGGPFFLYLLKRKK